MSTTGPLHPERLTRGETLDEACVGLGRDMAPAALCGGAIGQASKCSTPGAFFIMGSGQ